MNNPTLLPANPGLIAGLFLALVGALLVFALNDRGEWIDRIRCYLSNCAQAVSDLIGSVILGAAITLLLLIVPYAGPADFVKRFLSSEFLILNPLFWIGGVAWVWFSFFLHRLGKCKKR